MFKTTQIQYNALYVPKFTLGVAMMSLLFGLYPRKNLRKRKTERTMMQWGKDYKNKLLCQRRPHDCKWKASTL